MAKRYQVFVSSTYKDLKDERDQVIKQILTMGHIPVGMEMFSADDAEQWEVIQREIDQSDYYLVIFKQRYGSVIKQEGNIGFTEKEYDYAGEVGVPRIGFIIAEGVPVPPDHMEDSATLKRKLTAFKKKVMRRPVSFWRTPDELATQVLQALTKQIAKGNRPGWERATEDSKQALASFTRVSDENARLREELDRLKELTSANGPVLDCEFVDAEGNHSGRNLKIERADLQAIEQYKNRLADEISMLVRKIDESFELDRYTNGTNSLDPDPASRKEELYYFDPNRLRWTLERLHELKMPSPNSIWDFTQLYMKKSAGSLASILNLNDFEPIEGEDFQRYKLFTELENILSTFEMKHTKYKYDRTHVQFKLNLSNKGKISAEDFTVRVEIPENIHLVDDTVDQTLQKPLQAGLRASYSYKLLAPDESLDVMSITMGTVMLTSELTFNVRVTGRNLPGAQVIPMTIQVNPSPEN